MTSKTPNTTSAAIEILRGTNDGDRLSPIELSLVQHAVNDRLTEQGEIAFYQLLTRVRTGYQAPYFHEIQHLTIDHEGYVSWKGTQVEHYTPSWAFSLDAKIQAQELASRCQHLESQGIPVNTTNAIWHLEKYSLQALS